MRQVPALFGVVKYEFKMQIRRRVLWITFLCIALLLTIRGGDFRYLFFSSENNPLLVVIAEWARAVNLFFPVAIGVLLADRLPRDRRTKVDELLTTSPSTLSVRILGKYLGSTLATIIPLFAFYCIGIGFLLCQTHNALVLPLALAAFATVVIPGIVFIAAFSIACPAILWVPLYQFLFIGYWFWGNALNPRNGIPTLSATILTPIGGYMASGFFGDNQQLIQHASVVQGVESMLLLLGAAAFVMVTLWRFMKWQYARQ
jgi:ABC-2 type transport system permease protein